MNFVTVHTVSDVKMGDALRRKLNHKIAVALNGSSKEKKNMAKMESSHEYYIGLRMFMDQLSMAQTQALADQGATDMAVAVFNNTGRKFDKIMVSRFPKEGRPKKPEVRYFVDRSDGSIYGPKSDLAPNLKHFFGTIYEADLWDWSGEYGVPKDEEKAGVVKVGGYGDYVHYTRKEDAVAMAG